MSGQNTEKQILAMVLLLVLSVASLGAYTWFDNGRRTEARSEILTKDAERAAWTFANNCRECHGNDGRGSESDASLVGPALNTPNNTYAFLTDNQGQLDALKNEYRYTITCGRNGTPMPPWSIDQGGSLDGFKIDNLVTLITTNAGNAWETAVEHAVHLDEVTIENLHIALDAAEATLKASGWFVDLDAAEGAIARTEAADAQLISLREAVAAAEESGEGLQEAQDVLAAYEKGYTALVLAAVTLRTSDDSAAIAAARSTFNAASQVQQDVAVNRAWLKVASEYQAAVDNLANAEERFAAGLPVPTPATQVTSDTCGQTSAELGDWLSAHTGSS
jgi:mono/diheme cytochrome c family protein